jgi:hypothetical protein
MKKSSSRLALCAISCFRRTFPPLKHHIAHHTAKKWLTPLFGFGLTHAPDQALGIDRKSTLSWKVSWEGSHSLQRAVCCKRGLPRGINSLKFKHLLALIKHWKPPLREAANTLYVMPGQNVRQENKGNLPSKILN